MQLILYQKGEKDMKLQEFVKDLEINNQYDYYDRITGAEGTCDAHREKLFQNLTQIYRESHLAMLAHVSERFMNIENGSRKNTDVFTAALLNRILSLSEKEMEKLTLFVLKMK